jgi:hypothetical protein
MITPNSLAASNCTTILTSGIIITGKDRNETITLGCEGNGLENGIITGLIYNGSKITTIILGLGPVGTGVQYDIYNGISTK